MSDNRKRSLSEEYPSLQLAYEQIKDVLHEQEQVASHLDSKTATLLVVATAVIGIGIPLGFSNLTAGTIWLAYLALVPVIVYIVAVILAIIAYRLSYFVTMNNPVIMRESFWHLPTEKFIYEILIHIEEAFEENDNKLQDKGRIINKLLYLLVGETMATVLWSAFVFGMSVTP